MILGGVIPFHQIVVSCDQIQFILLLTIRTFSVSAEIGLVIKPEGY